MGLYEIEVFMLTASPIYMIWNLVLLVWVLKFVSYNSYLLEFCSLYFQLVCLMILLSFPELNTLNELTIKYLCLLIYHGKGLTMSHHPSTHARVCLMQRKINMSEEY